MHSGTKCLRWLCIRCQGIVAWDLRHTTMLHVDPADLDTTRAPSTTRRALCVQQTCISIGLVLQSACRAHHCPSRLLPQRHVGVLPALFADKMLCARPATRASSSRWMVMISPAPCVERANMHLVGARPHVPCAPKTLPQTMRGRAVNAKPGLRPPNSSKKDSWTQRQVGVRDVLQAITRMCLDHPGAPRAKRVNSVPRRRQRPAQPVKLASRRPSLQQHHQLRAACVG